MNKFELSFNALRVPIDLLTILLAGYISFILRASPFIRDIRPIFFQFSAPEYAQVVSSFALLVLVLGAFSGLYAMKVSRTLVSEFNQVFSTVSTATLLVILYYFFASRDIFSSRFLLISLWFFSIALISIGRVVLRFVQTLILKYMGIGQRYVVLIGAGRVIDLLQETLQHRPEFNIVAVMPSFKEAEAVNFWQQGTLDNIIVADQTISPDIHMYINDFCAEHKIGFQYHPQLFDTYDKVDVQTIGGTILFQVKRTTLDGWGSIQKRVFDIVFSLTFIIVFSPLYLITALAIIFESRGSVIYRSIRVGAKNNIFPVYKFRSMYTDLCTDESNPESIKLEQRLLTDKGTKTGPVNKIKDDPRVTKVGSFIRKTSIDELPQFFNVLQGSMSIVGPRPHQPREVAQYEKHHKKVLTLKPGITGMAQVNGRSDLTFEEEVLYDTFYIENWSIWLDIIIILKTPLAILSPRKAD